MKNKQRIIFAMLAIILLMNIFFISAIDTTINARVNNEDTDFYIQSDSTANAGIDYLDSEVKSFPSGNYSFLYAIVEGKNLIINSFNTSQVPRMFNLTYETSPSQTGTLALTWNIDSDSSFTLTLRDYGATAWSTQVGSDIKMATTSSYSVALDATRKRNFTIIVNAATCSDGVQNQGESGTDCGGPCTACSSGGTSPGGGGEEPSCVPKCAGKTCGSDGCSGTCGTCESGKTCSAGNCVTVDCSCASSTCVGSTCNGVCPGTLQPNCAGKLCGFSPNGCGSCGSCNEGYRCESGLCALIQLECTSNSQCDDGYSCLAGNCICSSDICRKYTEPPLVVPETLVPLTTFDRSEGKCEPKFLCGEWSDCSIVYGVNQLISGDDMKGEITRICKDSNACFASFSEKRECSLKEEVVVSNEKWCGEEYTQIQNSKGTIIARLKSLPGGKFVTVDLNADSGGYCYFCYDGIKNNDETGVDCGGSSCISCEDKKPAISSKSYLAIFNFVKVWIVLLSAILIVLFALLFVLVKNLWAILAEYIRYKRAIKKVLVGAHHKSDISPKAHHAFMTHHSIHHPEHHKVHPVEHHKIHHHQETHKHKK